MRPPTPPTASTSPRTLAADLPDLPPGTPVALRGWVHRRRALATVTFLVLRDRSGLAQVVVRAGDGQVVPPEETVVEVTGVVTSNPQAPGGVEVTSPTVVLLTDPAVTPPVELWRPSLGVGLATMLDHAAVAWRHPAQRARWEVAAASLRGFRAALDAQGFTEVQSPKIVGSATESGADVFTLDYFGRPAFLAQSPQFFKQQLVGVFERVYEVGPVFRAEPHDTVRHLAEYVSLDVELGFVRDHRDVLTVLRDVLAGMVAAVHEHAGSAVAAHGFAVPLVPDEIPVIHFAEALALVGAPADEPDLAPEHERALGRWALAEHGSDLLAVEGYPMAKRPFYTHPQPGDARWSNSFDLLFRGVELVTGGQRLHRYADYLAAITARGEDPAAYATYLEAFEHGMPPHGGFAIGLERWTARLTGAANVREVALFPRDLHRLAP
ncbi:aspartate--tRNA(Asn) ligase [Oerskovia turbata]|uniref:Aspartate--tRNA(Asp/Asn) ligase n=1 Tax=Oerskovia turbata TaxID=1713 RepID=A0A4Q1KUC5_9CELL|nr:aspartate--tRNA(Asn) ligase [Oerskovia turbata]RXR23762.1 aspartate--tRNA(Asn) ligase [Oerskovia turbata]RXR33768.1 aspartate--tRNA(Asn) ligase [Oerskovia turbata]TGJ96825.1 aspartate--tRNA(Asn) ligase [Actinotalea fermentans ATCC 43279 = JCM 9966 = DSM 3133]